MAQKWKVEKLNELKEELRDYESYIFTDYRGLNVEQMNTLRNNLREKDVHFHVVKNRFMKRVFDELGYSNMNRFLINPTAIAYCSSGISEASKILVDSMEETSIQIKGGMTNGEIILPEDIVNISKLPSKETLIAQTVGLLNAPTRGFVFVLSDIISMFMRTLKAIEKKKSES